MIEMCFAEPAGGVQTRTDVLKEALQHHHVNSPLSLFNDTFLSMASPRSPSSVNSYIPHSFHSRDDDAP